MSQAAAYYAISAKVHAMYGNRMTIDDYHQLLSKKTISDAATFLQSHKGYHTRLAGLNAKTIHRETLESALRGVYVDEYRRISSFVRMEDKELMTFPMYRAEQDAILTSMRHLTSTSMLEPVATWAVLLQKKSKLDLIALQNATSFPEIVHAAEKTIYGSALQRIMVGESKSPTPAFVDNMMQVTYFSRLYKTMAKNYKGQTQQLIRQSLDDETDLLNLVQFLRLKKHFSQEDIQMYSFPLPCSAKLRREYVQQLLGTSDYDSAFSLVLNGPYAKLFRSIEPSGLEAYYYTLQFLFAKHQLQGATPTVYTPIAYLTLKEIELRNIISIIECIRYEADPGSFVTLIGI